MRETLRAKIPSPSRRLLSIVLIASTSHISATMPASSTSPCAASRVRSRAGCVVAVGSIPSVMVKGWQPAQSASATATRSASEARCTNSSGVCAPPPRGPSPSIVSGIVAAKWLASLAPPRARGTIGRPSSCSGGRKQRRGRRLRVHRRPDALHHRLERDAADLRRHAPRTPERRHRCRSGACRRRARPEAGTTLNASPERTTVGTTVSWSGPPGSAAAATWIAACASASSALRPFCGAEPECDARPVARTRSVPAPLRRTITPS